MRICGGMESTLLKRAADKRFDAKYTVRIVTSNWLGSGTDSTMRIQVVGNAGKTEFVAVNEASPGTRLS